MKCTHVKHTHKHDSNQKIYLYKIMNASLVFKPTGSDYRAQNLV